MHFGSKFHSLEFWLIILVYLHNVYRIATSIVLSGAGMKALEACPLLEISYK